TGLVNFCTGGDVQSILRVFGDFPITPLITLRVNYLQANLEAVHRLSVTRHECVVGVDTGTAGCDGQRNRKITYLLGSCGWWNSLPDEIGYWDRRSTEQTDAGENSQSHQGFESQAGYKISHTVGER